MASKRKALSKKTRFDVFKRDEFVCQYCGDTPPRVILEVDHIIPVADGGGNAIENLICSCFDCNRGKGAGSLSTIPATVKQKAERLRESEEQLKAFYKLAAGKRDRLESEAWEIVNILQAGAEEFDREDFNALMRFLEKIGYPEVLEAANIATAKPRGGNRGVFKYFCGICWNFIKGKRYA